MTQDEIIRMARESCPYTKELFRGAYYDGFIKAAALVAAHEREKCFDAAMKAAEKAVDVAIALEREACAKVCEQDEFQIYETAERCAAAIRARGEK